MHIERVKINQVRCLEDVSIDLRARNNIFIGDNGAGKTSILEALYLLTTAQGHRGDTSRLIKKGQDQATVFGIISSKKDQKYRVGVSRSKTQTHIRINGEDSQRSSLVQIAPVIFQDPQIADLVEEGPALRRRYLDWGVFHVEHGFIQTWRSYRRLLKQRNAALRSRAASITSWDAGLSEEATKIDQYRADYFTRLAPIISEIAERLLSGMPVQLRYQRGWTTNQSLRDVLAQGLSTDQEQGYTRAGPHRADFRIVMNEDTARHKASRGEQKLLSMALTLAQVSLHMKNDGEAPVLLLDDLSAELSSAKKELLVEEIEKLGVQTAMTFVDYADIPESLHTPENAMFHVEHRQVNRISR